MFLYRFSWYSGVVIGDWGIPIGLDPLIINRLPAEKPSPFRRKEGGGSAKGRRRFGEGKAEVRRRTTTAATPPRFGDSAPPAPPPRFARTLPHLGEGMVTIDGPTKKILLHHSCLPYLWTLTPLVFVITCCVVGTPLGVPVS